MTLQEKNLFELELKSSQELQSELHLQQEIDKVIEKENKLKSFKDTLDAIHQKTIEKPDNKIINLQNKWYWAAASITLFSGTAIYSIKTHLNSPDKLFNSFYQPYQPAIATRGMESKELTQQIMLQFEKGAFADVIETIAGNFNNKNIPPKLILIKGCAEMEMQEYSKAIKTFDLFNSKNYTFYTESGQWYQALCYLKNNDVEKSEQILKIIVERNTSYAAEAGELLKKLN